MTSVSAATTRLRGATGHVSGATARLAAVRPVYVLATLVSAQWLAVLALALTVRRNGWLFYQGGDQVWFYTGSWLQLHGQLPLTAVGYGLSLLLMPIAVFAGPNLLDALPAIVLLNVVVLVPAALVAMYGIGERIAGRIFGYWVAFLWIAVPFIGIKYTDAGFHQRYTEITLPQGLGLTAMSDFPSMVMLVIGAYFMLRAVQGTSWFDGAFAGLFIGFGIAIKPSSALVLAGAALLFLATRRWRSAAAFIAGIAPCVIALAIWKWRGLGYLPLFHAEHAIRLAAGATFSAPVGGLNLSKYIHLDWSHFNVNLDSLQEHFWSKRVMEWLVIAGIVGVARRSLALGLFVGGWFLTFTIVKGTTPLGNLEDTSLLRMLLPAAPAFVLMLAALPFLIPGVPRRLGAVPPPRPWATERGRGLLLAAGVAVFAVVPAAVSAASTPQGAFSSSVFSEQPGPIPVDRSFVAVARPAPGGVRLTWTARHSGSARVFYEVFRQTSDQDPSQVDSTRATNFKDTVPAGTYTYWVAVAANWLDDPLAGDGYVAGRPVTVTVR
jgi:dolichyl-phosphate-mannose-protein mannosyltransferase